MCFRSWPWGLSSHDAWRSSGRRCGLGPCGWRARRGHVRNAILNVDFAARRLRYWSAMPRTEGGREQAFGRWAASSLWTGKSPAAQPPSDRHRRPPIRRRGGPSVLTETPSARGLGAAAAAAGLLPKAHVRVAGFEMGERIVYDLRPACLREPRPHRSPGDHPCCGPAAGSSLHRRLPGGAIWLER